MTESRISIDKINELTAQAMHIRGGWDLDVCRTDALMLHGLWKVEDSVRGLMQYLEDQNAETKKDEGNVISSPAVPGPEAA